MTGLIGKIITVSIPFTISAKSAGASGYQEIQIPTGTIPAGYTPKMWCVRSPDISASMGIQLTVLVANSAKIWVNYYSPKAIAGINCSAVLLCERDA